MKAKYKRELTKNVVCNVYIKASILVLVLLPSSSSPSEDLKPLPFSTLRT